MTRVVIYIGGIVLLLSAFIAYSAPTSTVVNQLYITNLSSAGSPCLSIGSNGLVATTTCGTSFTTTTFNGLSATAYTLATSGLSGLQWSFVAPGTITLSMSTSSGVVPGFLSSSDWSTFNSKITTTSLSVTGSGLLTYNNTTGLFGNTINYVSSTAAGTGIQLSGSVGSVTITNGGVQTITAGSSTLVSSATGTVIIGQKFREMPFTLVFSTSTNTSDDYLFTPDSTTTVAKARIGWFRGTASSSASNVGNFNLIWDGANAPTCSNFSASSTSWHLFSSDQTIVSAQTTSSIITSFASSTIPAGCPVRVLGTFTSSTEVGLSLYFDQ